MPKRKTIEDVKVICENKGLILLTKDYKNKDSILIVEDQYHYKYCVTLGSLSDKRTKFPSKFATYNPYTIENIKNYITIHKLTCTLISTVYQSMNRHLLEFECECGNHYKVRLCHFLNANQHKCQKCGKKRIVVLQTLPLNYLETTVESYGYLLIDNGLNNAHNIHFSDMDGYKYKGSLYTLETRTDKISKFNIKNPYCYENLSLYIKKERLPISLDESSLKLHENSSEYLKFRCGECNEIFSATIEQVVYRERYRCRKCTKSKSGLEKIVERYLQETGMKYVEQKRFTDCKNIRQLPFDFYLPDYNTVIEVMGDQHYYQNKLFKQTLEERQRIDSIKKQYCIDNEITYIDIPHWKISNKYKLKTYKVIIDNILNQN